MGSEMCIRDRVDESLSESADQVRGEAQRPPTRVDTSPKKTAAVVQAVTAEEQRQMEMDFVGQVASDDLEKEEDDAQLRTALDGLDDLRSMMAKRSEAGHAE